MITGKTQTGFEFSIDEKVADDMEFVDAVADCMSGEDAKATMGLSLVINKLFGMKEKKKLYDHCRTEDGRVPIEKLSAEITDMFSAIGENKTTKNS
jgi:hypothetical protein